MLTSVAYTLSSTLSTSKSTIRPVLLPDSGRLRRSQRVSNAMDCGSFSSLVAPQIRARLRVRHQKCRGLHCRHIHRHSDVSKQLLVWQYLERKRQQQYYQSTLHHRKMDFHWLHNRFFPTPRLGIKKSEDDHPLERYILCFHQYHGKQLLHTQELRSFLLLFSNK